MCAVSFFEHSLHEDAARTLDFAEWFLLYDRSPFECRGFNLG